jgi:transposase
MIQITPQMRILLATQAADFRKGIDGLSRLCRDVMGADPFSGYVFVFRNRRKTAIKVLMYDGQGFWLCQKRLSKGRFRWWPQKGGDGLSHLAAYQLNLLLWNGNPAEVQVGPVWKKIRASK